MAGNSQSQLGFGFEQRIREGVTLTLSAFIDGKKTSGSQLPRVFEHHDYGGRAAELEAGTYIVLTDEQVGDNIISSVRVPTGWKVTLFTDPGLEGRSLVLTADLARLDGEFNDKVSSIKVEMT
ncbi:peptidase inhibitor family I36 protein [Streptomyces sp. NPDC090080]|uniref:peptidase inhibitor family I36 protein n=1 Tax=Streptomyces sp. NPDC090080 TaxID=3365939 RepID=UPI0037F26571